MLIPDAAVITREASELGWRPGVFMPSLEIDGVTYIKMHTCKDNDGDTMYVEYHRQPRPMQQYDRTIVRVFND